MYLDYDTAYELWSEINAALAAHYRRPHYTAAQVKYLRRRAAFYLRAMATVL